MILLLLPSSLRAADDQAMVAVHEEGVLGTSCDMKIRGGPRDTADLAIKAAQAKVQRLAKVLDYHQPDTEISRLNTAPVGKPFPCSAELFEVLEGCEKWRVQTGGAFNANVGRLMEIWREASQSQAAPDEKRLQAAAEEIQGPLMKFDKDGRTVTPLRKLHLTVGSLGKGYIVDQALAAAKAAAPNADAILICIGGDTALWNAGPASRPWVVAVADPVRSAENEKPLVSLSLRNRGVATSGTYARYVTVDGRRHSHIIDPRTGKTADGIPSATVVAADAATATALSTVLSVLGPEKGLALVDRLDGVECLLVDAAGKQFASRGWAALTDGRTPSEPAEAATIWPAGYKVTLSFNLGAAGNVRKYKRPYLAAWIEDSAGKHVTTLAVWGSKEEWRRDLRSWYRLGVTVRQQARNVTRASRPAGQYSLVWDGKDQAGKPVKPGAYTVRLEIVREDAGHVDMKAAIECLAKPAKAIMPANAECRGATVAYGP